MERLSLNHALQQADRRLVQIVDAQLAEAARLAGEHLHCHAGCAVCCFGPFLITGIDAWRLRLGLANADAATTSSIRERAATGAAKFEADPHFSAIFADDSALEEFTARQQNVACPVLDPDSGHCQLYEHRPIACRTYGPPTILDGRTLPPCPLCFKGATVATVEAARVVVNPAGAESTLLEAAEDADLNTGSTLIALALR